MILSTYVQALVLFQNNIYALLVLFKTKYTLVQIGWN
jgi:hypothetical protein